MSQIIFDRLDITLYLTDKIRTSVQLPDLLQHGVEKKFKEMYGIDMLILGKSKVDDDRIYVGQPEEQKIIIWNGYTAIQPADTRKFGFLRFFRARQRLSIKLKDTLMEALRDYYIDSVVSSPES